MTTSKSPKTYETLQQAGQRVGVSVRTLRRWISQGKLTAYRLTPRVVRLDPAEIDAMIQATATNKWGGAA